MTEENVLAAIRVAVREAWLIGSDRKNMRKSYNMLETAQKYAEGLIMPQVIAAIEQGREEGYQDGRATVVDQVAS